jgi:hypothetical protein
MTNAEIIAELICAPSTDIATRLSDGPDSAEVVGLWELNAALDKARREERTGIDGAFDDALRDLTISVEATLCIAALRSVIRKRWHQ